MEADTLNYIAATLCAVGGFSAMAWGDKRWAMGLFAIALVNVGLAVFTP